ncbi:MAG: DUF4296 domain-containing protein [Chitinophagaceae bacterium]|nr:DUF4296 domain-containing protein [Chitinophagaceae bacterium]
MIKQILACLLIIFLVSCKDNNGFPKGILKPKKMEVVLWDIIKIDTYTKEFIAKDSSKNVQQENALLQQQAFTKHGTTKEEFYKSYDYYKANSTLITALLDSITNHANNDRYNNFHKGKPGVLVEQ